MKIARGRDAEEAQIQARAGIEGAGQTSSTYDLSRELRKCLFDALACLGARTQNGPTFCGETRLHLRIELPVIDQIAFIHHEDKWNGSDFGAGAFFEFHGPVYGGAARAIRDEQIAGSPLKIGPANFLEIIISIEIPQDQIDLLTVDLNRLFVNLYADGSVVGLRKNALD